MRLYRFAILGIVPISDMGIMCRSADARREARPRSARVARIAGRGTVALISDDSNEFSLMQRRFAPSCRRVHALRPGRSPPLRMYTEATHGYGFVAEDVPDS